MLGYSDSTKESGYVAAELAAPSGSGGLSPRWPPARHRADAVPRSRRRDRAGRGTARARGRGAAARVGGGPAEADRAGRGRLDALRRPGARAPAPRDPDRGGDRLAVGPEAEAGGPAAEGRRRVMDALAAEARRAYRALVYDDPGFPGFFVRMTPIDEITGLQLGSRPARRAARDQRSIDDLRAIPWVFAWSQARVELRRGSGSVPRSRPSALGAPTATSGSASCTRLAVLPVAHRPRPTGDRAGRHRPGSRLRRPRIEPGDADRWSAIESEFDRTRRALDRLPLPTPRSPPTEPRPRPFVAPRAPSAVRRHALRRAARAAPGAHVPRGRDPAGPDAADHPPPHRAHDQRPVRRRSRGRADDRSRSGHRQTDRRLGH